MKFDFPTILVLITAFTGIFWVIDKIRNKKAQRLTASGATSLTKEQLKELEIIQGEESFSLVRTFAEAFPVILLVLILRSFIVEPFRIPSGSMLPTLFIGDFIAVNKYAYGLKLPITNTKILEVGEPKRGDVIVFKHPTLGVEFIKRVVGIPGDKVQFQNKKLIINDVQADYEKDGIFFDSGKVLDLYQEVWGREQTKIEEPLNDGHQLILDRNRYDVKKGPWIVPEGHYFAVGDNRDNSNDSRFWGMVPEKNILGRAFGIWMSWVPDKNGLLPIDWDRIGRKIE